MTAQKISIIVPSFNQGHFLEATILSVLNQSYKNFELIVIDGGSSDQSLQLIKKYSEQINYWVSEKDNGQSHAINKGLSVASGNLVTWLNSDDYYEPGTLEFVAQMFGEDPELSIVHGMSRLFGDNIRNTMIGLKKDICNFEYLPYMRFPQPSSFFRKELLNSSNPLNTSLHFAMDFELVARSVLLGAKIKRTNHLLSHYRMHPASKSNHDLKFLEEWSLVFQQVLRSVDHGKPFAEKLENLGLVLPSTTNSFFVCNIKLTLLEIEQIFLEHLNLQYHYHYKASHKKTCAAISAFLKREHSSFYQKNNYKKFNFRLNFIPPLLLRLLRKTGR